MQVGSGQCLPITHIGNISFPTLFSLRKLLVTRVLVLPQITKELISISKLTEDDAIIIEFFTDVCIIKDNETQAIMLQGKLREVLYQLTLGSFSLKNTNPRMSNIGLVSSVSRIITSFPT